jgi:hypothetical protein
MCEELSVGVLMRKRAAKRWAQRILGISENFLGYQVITGPTRNECMNDKCKQLSIRMYRWSGIAKAVGTKSRENIREYLRNLRVQPAIIWTEGALREKVFSRT